VKSTSISKPASSSFSPPSSVCSASYDSYGPKPGHGHVAHDVGEHDRLDLRHPDLAPVARATGATAPTWSKCVCVSRMPSSFTPRASMAPRSLSGLVARVHDQSAVGAVAPEDVAVLLDLPDGERAHVHQRAAFFFLR
jgi:hypothetical protein